MEGKRRRIFIIVSFLDCIQEKSMGRQQVSGNSLSQRSMICIICRYSPKWWMRAGVSIWGGVSLAYPHGSMEIVELSC